METRVRENKRLTEMLEEEIKKFYSLGEDCEPLCIDRINKYSKYKRYFLYPITIMSGNVMGILTSIATCLSMNIFTNFISFQKGSFFDLILWVLRLVFAIVLNVCIAKISIICTVLKDKDMENQRKGIYRAERLIDKLKEYDFVYDKIKKQVIWGAISLFVLFFLIVIFPIGEFVFANRGYIETYMKAVGFYLDKLLSYIK